MKIERQLQGTLSTIFTELIKERSLDKRIATYTTQEEGRADLMIKTAKGKPIFFIELKDPTAKDGKTIFNAEIILREMERAQRMEIEYFGICNFCSLTLIKVTKLQDKIAFQDNLFTLNDLNTLRKNYNPANKDIQQKFRNIANYYIDRALDIIDKKPIQFAKPDELYIFKIRKLIEAYSDDVTEKAYEKHLNDRKFNKAINEYAQSQQWNAPQSKEEIEKLVHIALLVLVSKLIFYKTYYDYNSTENRLSEISISPEMTLPEELEEQLWEYFEEFKRVTRNFETLIGERNNIIAKIPFVSDASIDLVKEVILTGKQYDFAQIQYDVIGRIFEELIREDERHKLGQYFTPPVVIDFINAFCIHDKNDIILDPSCGSGTFLIRAYQRKKELGQQAHDELLKQIYGCDISNYPAYLATLNLAIRNMKKASYPRVLHKDFFHFLRQNKYSFHLPNGKLIKQQPPLFDAIVGNPPYTRQEDINVFNIDAKNHIQQTIKEEWKLIDLTQKVEPSQRTSIYGYFLYHAGALLKEGGYMGFIVGNSWLSTDYGEEMQTFMLQHFEVVAIIETEIERFFPSADVNTNIFILRRQSNFEKRQKNLSRFVYLTEKLSDIQQHYKTFDNLINKTIIFPPPLISKNEIYGMKIQIIPQKDLADNSWLLYFKAPPVYWKILEKAKNKFVKLETVAELHYGIKTGCNEYFYGENVTDSLKEKEVIAIVNNTENLSLAQIQANGLSIFKNGIGELWLIEEEFLVPAIKSTKEIDSYVIQGQVYKFMLLYVNMLDHYFIEYDNNQEFRKRKQYNIDQYREDIQQDYPYLWAYILYGESTPFSSKDNKTQGEIVSEKPSCKSRPAWWDLGEQVKHDIILMQFRNKRNWTPIIAQNIKLANTVFIGKYKTEDKKDLYNLSLNSMFMVLQSELLGRVNLGDGLLTTYGPELAKLLVLHTKINDSLNNKLTLIINNLSTQKVKTIFEEMGNHQIEFFDINKVEQFRYEIDDLLLEIIGFTKKEEREQIIIDLYKSVIQTVYARLEKSKSLDNKTNKRGNIDFSMYQQALEAEIKKEKLVFSNNISSGRRLQVIISTFTQDLKLQDKLLQDYWKTLFGEKYDEKVLQKREQGTLF